MVVVVMVTTEEESIVHTNQSITVSVNQSTNQSMKQHYYNGSPSSRNMGGRSRGTGYNTR